MLHTVLTAVLCAIFTLSVGCSDDATHVDEIDVALSPLDDALPVEDDNVRVSYHVNGPDLARWSIAENGGFVTTTNEQSIIVAPLILPHKCLLDAVEVVIAGGNSHLKMPTGMPTVELVRRDILSHGVEYIGVAVDKSESLEFYQMSHSVVLDIQDELVDATRARYHVVFKTEYGENASKYSWFHGIRHRCAPAL